MFNQPQQLIQFLFITAITFITGISTPVLADDTEIYLNSSSSTGQSNILFNLDTSGSMSSIVDEDNDGITGEPGERSRIDVLKEAMNTLLDTMPALNVGLMRYHYYGGPILFPVANLATEACVIEGNCTTSTAPTGTQTITKLLSDNNDDATEADAGTMDLSSSTLDVGPRAAGAVCTDTTVTVSTTADNDASEMRAWTTSTTSAAANGSSGNTTISASSDMEIPRDGGTNQLNGLWFRSVNVPVGATISNASITFQIDEQESGEIDVDIRAVDPGFTNNTNNFATAGFDPESHYGNLIGSPAEWTASDNPAPGDFITTDNIASLVQSIVDDGDWVANRNMVFLIEDDLANTSQNSFRTVEEGSGGTAPQLSVTYQTCTGGAAILSARSGLRFQNVKIPQGAVINAASIVLTATAADASAPTFNIHLENTDDAAAMTTTAGNLAGRTYTGPVTWTGVTTPAVTNPWVVDTEYPTPDLKTLVQTVVNRGGWCGGNDLLFRIERLGGDNVKRSSYSRENDSSKAPQFIVNYSLTARDGAAAPGSPDSCNVTTSVTNVSSGADDAEEQADGSMNTSSSDLEMTDDGNTQTIGIRFKNIPIAKSTTITSAKITFTADGSFSGATSLALSGELNGDASAFSSAANDITGSGRPKTGTVAWTTGSTPALTAWTDDLTYETPDIATIIQAIVNQGDWAAGNDLALFVSGTGKRRAESFNGDSARAPVLTIEYQGSPVETKTTVRDRLKEIVDELIQRGGTPIAGSMLEAAYYFRGEGVRFGLERGTQSSSDNRTRVSHQASYTANGATETFPGTCTSANLSASDCKGQEIFGGTPKYKSPIIAECQENFLINLTDGGGYYTGGGKTNSQGVSVDEQSLIESFVAKDADGNSVSLTNCDVNTTLTDGSTIYSGSSHNECTVQLAKFLHENDQIYTTGQNLQDSSVTVPIDGTQTLNIYTIGFNLCGSGNVTSVDSANEQVCCSASNAQHNSTGVCSAPLTDPDKIKVLKAQADVGGGEYFNANTAEELVAAFSTITGQIVSRSTSFASPSIAVNTFNRLFSRDEIYFGLFKPEKQTRWRGNVKKYNVCIDSDGPDGVSGNTDDCTLGEVLDANDASAVVQDTAAEDFGLFESSSTSEWTVGTDVPDGRDIDKGGAGAALDIVTYTARKFYTDQDASGLPASATSLSSTGFNMTSADILTSADLAHIRAEVCSSTATPPDTACIADLLWMFGADIDNEDNDAATTTRWWLNDVLHSSPNVITYGKDSDGDFIDKIIFGTNDGALHFINGTSGKEEWAFVPFSEFDNVASLRSNGATAHIYGMDGTPILRVEDTDSDGDIESGEKVHVYTSQRRGGGSIFGLDLSVPAKLTSDTSLTGVTPTLLWRIDAGSTGFEHLGDTWSDPAVAKIRTKTGTANTSRTVLIFGGGYENGLDDLDSGGVHRNFGLEGGDSGNGGLNQGNAIYIVDADSGALIFSISNAAGTGITTSGADIEVPGMNYAIPSNISVFDSNGDGFDDRLYVGDSAGNIWRVDLGSDIEVGATSPEGSTLVGQLAQLSTAAVGTAAPTNERRFFYRPSISQLRDTANTNAPNGEFDAIVISSGNRAHPLDLDVANRLYVLRDTQINPMFGSGGLATNYPQTVAVNGSGQTTSQGSPILDNGTDLVDATTTALTGTTAEKNALGWYINFDTVGAVADRTDGEKGLSAARVFFGTIFATTYVPAESGAVADVCSANEGTGRIFNFNILTANAALDWDGSGGTPTKADAVQTLGAGGIPPEVVPVYTKDGVQILAGPQLIDEAGKNEVVQTYWYNE